VVPDDAGKLQRGNHYMIAQNNSRRVTIGIPPYGEGSLARR
jgi:hypothetical protein